jgi:hypothetical protein
VTKYDVKIFDTGKAKNVAEDLAAFLNELASEGWTIISVAPDELKGKGTTIMGQRIDSLVVVVGR